MKKEKEKVRTSLFPILLDVSGNFVFAIIW